ncbi:MAG: PilN domain-containing protein [Planctomycetota bacterium]
MNKSKTHQLYADIDFRPDWYLVEQKRQRTARFHRVAAMVMFCLIVALVTRTWHSRTELTRYHADQVTQVNGVNTKMTDMQMLQRERVELAAQMRVHRSLYQPLEYHQVLGVLASFLPESVALRQLGLSESVIERSRPMTKDELASQRKLKTRRASSKTRVVTEHPVLELEITAVASSHVVIANLIGDLASSRLFDDVKMIHSKQVELDGLTGHEFSLRMNVPLEQRYRFVEGSGVDESGPTGGIAHVR